MKQSSRRWIVASVMAAFVLTLIISNIDETKLYHALKTQLAQTGVILDAKGLSLSAMYMGSIHLNDVDIQTQAFTLHAEEIAIDLNLAALLTGKVLPQALYIRFADINILQTEKDAWLNFIESGRFKLKRIDITQSEIHFQEQHLTLEQTNLDIRDIGRNKNPKAELRAHIGDGRIDAHGYLHLKHGKITRGFSRIKLVTIPLSFMPHHTTLETLTGSITAHMYQDKPWQAFGHLSFQKDKRNHLELRGKIKESDTKLFAITDMVLQIKDAGSIQISGFCDTLDSCQINSKSTALNLNPISELFNNPKYAQLIQANSLQNILIQNRWQHGTLSNSGQFSWKKLNYQLRNPIPEQTAVSIDAGKVTFQGLTYSPQHYWHLDSAKIATADNKDGSINITSASLQHQGWKVPLQLQHSHLWLPITQIVLDQQKSIQQITGDGALTGHLVLKHSAKNNRHISFDLDASQSQFSWLGYSKQKNIPLTLQGKVAWQDDESKPNHLQAFIHLSDSYANINFTPTHLSVQDMAIDFNQLKSQKITFAQPLQRWHGSIAGNFNIDLQQQKLLSTQLQLQQFGTKTYHLTGEVGFLNQQWDIPQLSWQFEKNHMQLTTNKKGQVNIAAEQLDSHALYSILQAPLMATGQLTVQKLIMPLGILHEVSAGYSLNQQQLNFKQFKAHFYQGNLSAESLNISHNNEHLHVTSRIQVGGIRLNRWQWLHKQFSGHLQGSMYATLNLDADFKQADNKLSAWQGDGDIMVYNAKWLLNNKRIQADKFALSMRKRDKMIATFLIAEHQQKSSGNINIDAYANISGALKHHDDTFTLANTWPNLQYKKTP